MPTIGMYLLLSVLTQQLGTQVFLVCLFGAHVSLGFALEHVD